MRRKNRAKYVCRLTAAAFIGLVLLFLQPVAFAAEQIGDTAAQEDSEALYAESGAKDAFTALDEETLDILDSLGVDVSDPSSLFSVTPAKVVSSAVGLVTGYLAQPLKRCAVIFGLLLLFALTDAAAPSIGKASEAGGMLFMLLLSLAVIAPVAECVSRILSAVRLLSDFTVLLIPVMAGLTAASGKPVLSASLSAASMGAAQAVGGAVDLFFVPLTGAYAALCLVAAVNPLFNLQNLALFFRRLFTVTLGAVSSLFSGVLALKGVAGSAADTLAFKGAKFLIGGLVPVVGGALSEGLSTVTAALESVNKSVGALGILAMIFIVLPPLLEVLVWWAALYFCSFAATLTGQTQVAFYLSGVSNVIVMLNILLLFDAFVFISAVGILLRFAGG